MAVRSGSTSTTRKTSSRSTAAAASGVRTPGCSTSGRRARDRGSIPATLIRGDLHPENVAISDGGLPFFDWSKACVTHPFMDMFLIFNERDEALRIRLRVANLEVWTDFEPMGRLLELWSLCGVVHALHHEV